MTHSEAFLTVKTHLLKQGSRAVNEFGQCVYRTADRKECPVGVLIPDAEYSTRFEGRKTLSFVRSQVSTLRSLDYDFLRGLQFIHDKIEVDRWLEALDGFEMDHALLLLGEPAKEVENVDADLVAV